MSMTKTEKQEIQHMISEAVENGVIEAVKTIFSDKDRLSDLLEDIALAKAIEEGMSTETIDKTAFLENLKSRSI